MTTSPRGRIAFALAVAFIVLAVANESWAANTTTTAKARAKTATIATTAARIASTTKAAITASADTLNGMKQAKWGSNVTVTYADGVLRYVSTGLPNHARQSQYALPNTGARAVGHHRPCRRRSHRRSDV